MYVFQAMYIENMRRVGGQSISRGLSQDLIVHADAPDLASSIFGKVLCVANEWHLLFPQVDL